MACVPATAPMNQPSLILNHTVWIIPELHSSLPSWILPETRERIWVSSLRYRIAVDPVMAYFWIIVVAQLPQSSYLPLQTPYCLIGLGRTNNYIEEMFAGVSRNQVSFYWPCRRFCTQTEISFQEQNYLFYEGVIPNSQLIFIPYQPSDVKDSSS